MSEKVDTFINELAHPLRIAGYQVSTEPVIPGVRARLYAVLEKPRGAVFSKYFNHYLFLDWDNDLFSQSERLLDAQQWFSRFVNSSYKVPHGFRLTLPNLALVAVSEHGFDEETRQIALNRYFVPLLNGETGQIVLADLQAKSLTCHFKPHYRQTGLIPLEMAVNEINILFSILIPEGKLIRFE